MNSLYKLTKGELIVMCRKLQKENNALRIELDNLSECYTELENEMGGGEASGILQRVCKNQRQAVY